MSNGMLVLAIIGCFVASGFGVFGLSCLFGYMFSGGDDHRWTFWSWFISCVMFAACMTIYIITTNVKGA